VGVIPFLLPYLEQEAIYRQLVINWDLTVGSSATLTPPWWKNAGNWTLAQTRIPNLVCPSDTPYDSTVGTIYRMHAWNKLPLGVDSKYDFFANGTEKGETLGRTNYAGVAGPAGFAPPSGVLSNRSRVALATITNGNGTSITRMFGETLGGHLSPSRDYSLAWIGPGVITFVPDGFGPTGSPIPFHFSSWHPGIVNFCYADGSVRAVKQDQADLPTDVPDSPGLPGP
jgi:prepilin-type processing-associated H-X9-DG protein